MKKEKIEAVFSNELSLITITSLTDLIIDTLFNASDEFWTIPTSTTGKYHPDSCNKKHGLILHTKLVVAYCIQLIEAYYTFDNNKNFHTSIIISAALLHDIGKKGRYQNYKLEYVNHPLVASKIFEDTYKKMDHDIDNDVIDIIVECINYHGGIFGPKEIEKPITEFNLYELIVYTSDFLASRKYQNKEPWMKQQLDNISSVIAS